jgi:hypothetical protein
MRTLDKLIVQQLLLKIPKIVYILLLRKAVEFKGSNTAGTSNGFGNILFDSE